MWPAKYINDWKEDRKANYIKYVCLYFVSHCSSQTFFSLSFILYFHPFSYSSLPFDHVHILFFSCYRHALREYNIHKTLDHPVSGPLITALTINTD